MSDFKPIESQETLDAIIGKRVEKVREKTRKEVTEELQKKIDDANALVSKNAELQKTIESLKKEAEKYANYETTLADITSKAKTFELENAKTKAAMKYGLDVDAIEFLKGDTVEEIEESAEKIKNLVGVKNIPMRKENPNDHSDTVYKDFSTNLFNTKG